MPSGYFPNLEGLQEKQEILTYLAPSKICDGVGVFAWIDIPKDSVIFPIPDEKDFVKIPWSAVTDRAREKIEALTSASDEDGFYTDVDINRFDISYYVNHSYHPNAYYDSTTGGLYAMRDIKMKEEILQFYPPNERKWL